ncbi:MAG TPA: hypothetical protein VGD80_34895 [Kofleriaceae bacterium]
MYPAGRRDAGGTETKVICRFASNASGQCWVSNADRTITDDCVAGDPRMKVGVTSVQVKVRVFAGSVALALVGCGDNRVRPPDAFDPRDAEVEIGLLWMMRPRSILIGSGSGRADRSGDRDRNAGNVGDPIACGSP